jgi:N-acetylmuramoyl-L-alanine amidase
MSRAALRFLTVAACALLLMGGAVGVEAAPVSVARSLESVRLAGVDYIELDAFCRRFGLKPTTADGRHGKVGYASKWTSLEFEVDSRECAVNTLRVFLGDPLRSHRGRVVIGLIDAERLLTPILLPGPDGWAVPALKTIVIDPGHGGGDPGTGNKRLGINEKTMTLDTARRLKKLLDAAGYKTILTRNSDRQLADDKVADLLRRDEIASQANADLFISVHYNSIASGADRVSGVEVFTLTPRYQYSTSDTGRDDDKTARTLSPGNANDHWNTLAGYNLHRELLQELKAPDRGLKRARFAVLRMATCPAVLVEAGYLSNDAEARKIATPAYRQRIAQAIANGVRAYDNSLASARRTN